MQINETNGIPTGPVDREPIGYPPPGTFPTSARKAEILSAIFREADVELGAYDQRIASWLADTADWSTYAVIASWVQRATSDRD